MARRPNPHIAQMNAYSGIILRSVYVRTSGKMSKNAITTNLRGFFAMKYIAFLIVKYILRLLYLPMKLRPVKDRVVFLSRESKKKSLDMRLLSEELARTAPEIEQVFRLFMMEPGLSGKIAYGWHMLGDMWALAGARIAICDTYSIPVSCLHHKPSLYVIQMGVKK